MRVLCVGAFWLILLALAACGSTGSPGPLALNHVYSEGGISFLVVQYDRRIDPATLPVALGPLDANLPGAHIIRLDCVLENTTNQDWDVEPRLQATTGGATVQGSADEPPLIINTTLTHDTDVPVDDNAVYRVPAHQSVIRSLYYEVTADLRTMALYLNVWTPPNGVSMNLASLFTLDVTSG